MTIGVLVSGIRDEFTKYLCKGVFQQARQMEVNIVVFPGKYIDRDLSVDRNLAYEYQYETAFAFANKENLDALVVAAGSIGCFTTEERIRKMLSRYKDIPVILVASKIEGYPCIVFDNYQGIKEGLEYLIEKRGYTKFGMVGGSDENSDARERKETFKRVLEAHGIPFHESMFVEGDLSRRSSGVCRKLLTDNPDIEAIFCVNDETAMGLYEELRLRGIQIGKDVSVFGYDDTVVSAKAAPSLSSVRADPGKLGEEAIKLAIRMANGDPGENLVIPTRFVKRDSFCHTASEEGSRQQVMVDRENSFNDIFYHYCHDEMQKEMKQLRESYDKLLEALTVDFAEEDDSISKYIDITARMEEFISLGGVKYADPDNLLTVLEEIYRWMRQKQTDEGKKYRLRDIFSILYIKIIRAMNNEIGNMQESKNSENEDLRVFVQAMLKFEKGRDESYCMLLERLDWMDIKNAAIYTLPKPILHLQNEPFDSPEYMDLKAVLRDGIVYPVSMMKQKKKLGQLFCNSQVLSEKRCDRVVFPLFFNEMVYGMLLCDMSESVYENGEFMANQMSSAAKMITLLKSNEKIQQQLEDNLATLRNYNIQLDTISKSDPLTGILNRRGFYSEAEKCLQECRRDGKNLLVIYADMNNLKIINDRYGHDEGDFSLKLIGETLLNFVKGKGFAGRIGGDEYACALIYEQLGDGTEFLDMLYRWFDKYNHESEKEYTITISAGCYMIKTTDMITLKEAMQQADEKLYVRKQLRKKEVTKRKLPGFN
ncbi:MAG: GGDEF domain-containing protein [Lachnospiraceae bacterium]